MQLSEFNKLPREQALAAISQCCAATGWVEAVVAARPFSSFDALLEVADMTWGNVSEADLLEAFTAHPQIGNVATLREKYASTKALAASEQASVSEADEQTIVDLADLNKAYLEKFGFIFIVCATGKSAAQMLDLLKARLPNGREEELVNAATEQHKITKIRLHKLFNIN